MEEEQKQKKPFYKRWWFIALVAVFIIGTIGGGDDEEVEEAEEQVEEVVEVEPETEEESPSEEEVQTYTEDDFQSELDSLGTDVFGDGYRETRYLWDVEETNYFDDGSIDPENSRVENIVLEVKVSSSQEGGFLMDVEDYLKELQSMEFDNFSAVGYGDFVDEYGEESEQKAISIDLTKETIDRINFDNFDWRNLPNIAENYFAHNSMGDLGL